VQQQRRLAHELAFRTQQARVELMLQAATDAVISFDERGALLLLEPGRRAAVRPPLARGAGQAVYEVLPLPQLAAAMTEGIAGLCEAGDDLFSGAVIEIDARGFDGRALPVELSLTAYRTERGW
jgi:nitrogen fixation/metabolism regulation signal transduction histidine kinase